MIPDRLQSLIKDSRVRFYGRVRLCLSFVQSMVSFACAIDPGQTRTLSSRQCNERNPLSHGGVFKMCNFQRFMPNIWWSDHEYGSADGSSMPTWRIFNWIKLWQSRTRHKCYHSSVCGTASMAGKCHQLHCMLNLVFVKLRNSAKLCLLKGDSLSFMALEKQATDLNRLCRKEMNRVDCRFNPLKTFHIHWTNRQGHLKDSTKSQKHNIPMWC